MREHAAEHHECALREIDDATRVVDHAEADADQPIDAADADAAQRDLREVGEIRHAPPPPFRDRPRSPPDRRARCAAGRQRSSCRSRAPRSCRRCS